MKNYQFYHIYPLGMLNKLEGEENNNRTIMEIGELREHMKSMNINALYLGPVFESVYHGYDTVDYYKVDRRLGRNEDLTDLVEICHQDGIDVILDCVFNHVSREFFAFQDCLNHKDQSRFKDWFYIDFTNNNFRNDGFTYQTWDGHDELVKLNLNHPEVRDHLIGAAKFWIDTFNIDGLRLDAADVMDLSFTKSLVDTCHFYKKDFYIFGEMVHGDYQGILASTGMDGLTNYECYKGLYSSLNDANYHEIAYSFKRLFGEDGLLKGKVLYNFVDNHDVNRVASTLKSEHQLYPLYLMIYTMMGYTSIYYASEFALKGRRTKYSDRELRPNFQLANYDLAHPLYEAIKTLSGIRKDFPVLAFGHYEQVLVDHQLIGYRRFDGNRSLLIFINSSEDAYTLDVSMVNKLMSDYDLEGYDILNQESINMSGVIVYPNWGRIIK